MVLPLKLNGMRHIFLKNWNSTKRSFRHTPAKTIDATTHEWFLLSIAGLTRFSKQELEIKRK